MKREEKEEFERDVRRLIKASWGDERITDWVASAESGHARHFTQAEAADVVWAIRQRVKDEARGVMQAVFEGVPVSAIL